MYVIIRKSYGTSKPEVPRHELISNIQYYINIEVDLTQKYSKLIKAPNFTIIC